MRNRQGKEALSRFPYTLHLSKLVQVLGRFVFMRKDENRNTEVNEHWKLRKFLLFWYCSREQITKLKASLSQTRPHTRQHCRGRLGRGSNGHSHAQKNMWRTNIHTNPPTHQPTQWLIGRVARDKKRIKLCIQFTCRSFSLSKLALSLIFSHSNRIPQYQT